MQNDVANNIDVELCCSNISNINDYENMYKEQNGTKFYKREAIEWKTDETYEICSKFISLLTHCNHYNFYIGGRHGKSP